MIRLGVAPKLIDFSRGALQTIDQWFNQVTIRFTLQQKNGAMVLSEIPTNQWGLFKDTSSGNVYLIVNDNGTLKKVQLV